MPTETFFRLPKEKQDCILASAMKEFSRVPFHEASINQIIMNAGIPRGSFYMYFKDKEDLYSYLLKTHEKKLEEGFTKALQEHDGDLIDTYLSLFETVIHKIRTDKNRDFFHRMIMNTDFKNDSFFKKHELKNVVLSQMFEHVDFTKLKLTSKEDLSEIVDLIHMMFIHNLVAILKFGLTKEEALEKFKRQLNFLKNGFYQSKGGEIC